MRKKPKYDAIISYKGKVIGKCTRADGEAYAELMKKCNSNAADVLNEYSYFSLNLLGILQKTVKLQLGASVVP